jgi:hypothetical protein
VRRRTSAKSIGKQQKEENDDEDEVSSTAGSGTSGSDVSDDVAFTGTKFLNRKVSFASENTRIRSQEVSPL